MCDRSHEKDRGKTGASCTVLVAEAVASVFETPSKTAVRRRNVVQGAFGNSSPHRRCRRCRLLSFGGEGSGLAGLRVLWEFLDKKFGDAGKVYSAARAVLAPLPLQ